MRRGLALVAMAVAASLGGGATGATASAEDNGYRGDQRWVAYQTNRHDGQFGPDGIRLVHPDGTGDHRIAAATRDAQLLPDWHPDGDRLVYTIRGGAHEPLYEYDLTTGRSRQLFECDGDCFGDDEPTYSPDGTTVAFVRYLAPFTEFGPADCSLWLGDLATLAIRRLTHNGSCDREYFPRWSPDGSRLAYMRERYDDAVELVGTAVFVVDVATGTETRLTDWSDAFGDPDWSPDGEWIVMDSRGLSSFGFSKTIESNLYRMRPDGSGVEQLTHYRGSKVRAVQPRYTPDGSALVFTARTPNSLELWIMPATGGKPWVVENGGVHTHGTMQPVPQ